MYRNESILFFQRTGSVFLYILIQNSIMWRVQTEPDAEFLIFSNTDTNDENTILLIERNWKTLSMVDHFDISL